MFPIVPAGHNSSAPRSKYSSSSLIRHCEEGELKYNCNMSWAASASAGVKQKKPKCESFQQLSCIAIEAIPNDSKTLYIGALDTVPVIKLDTNIPINISETGHVQCENEKIKENVWIKHIRLSNDVHSNNCIVELSADTKELRLRTLRNIECGEELTMWFSEDVVALMFIPFLTPANIRGKILLIFDFNSAKKHKTTFLI